MEPLLILREESAPQVVGRTLTVRLLTFGRVYEPSPTLRERVMPGSFKGPIARPAGVLRYRHAGERPGDADDLSQIHGVVTALRQRDDTLEADAEVFAGPDGDKLLRLAASGAVTGVSMAAVVADASRAADGVIDIRRVSTLNGFSLTPTPAYPDAGLLAIREADEARSARLRAERAANEVARARLRNAR